MGLIYNHTTKIRGHMTSEKITYYLIIGITPKNLVMYNDTL